MRNEQSRKLKPASKTNNFEFYRTFDGPETKGSVILHKTLNLGQLVVLLKAKNHSALLHTM